MTVAQAPRVPLRERSIRYVKGVGPHRLAQFAQLGIDTVEDACYYPPRRYEDRTHLLALGALHAGELATVRGRIAAAQLRRIRRGPRPAGHQSRPPRWERESGRGGGQTIFEVRLEDGSGRLQAVWFNQPYLAQQLSAGDEVILYGQVESRPRLQMVHPELERLEPGEEESIHMGRIVPIYALTGGISQRLIRQIIWTVLEGYGDDVEEVLPEPLRSAREWPGVAQAVRDLHFPGSWHALASAQQRLAFEELFLFQLALAQRRLRTTAQQKPHRYQLDGRLTDGLRTRLPFVLTASQQHVLAELFEDLGRPHPMHRLLQGDVGCGKTILIVFLIAAAVQSGHQVALMAPTELLAEQHARVAESLLGPMGVTVGLLSQGVAAADRKRLATLIAQGKCAVVIGTHALIQTHVAFQRLSLVVIDEQHKFGVIQRAHLAKKADTPDVLVVTATPIPRTLALSLYGDLDVSTISELPQGRRPITTRWMSERERPQLYDMIRRELAAGRQGYVVYPLVEEGSAKDLKAATQMAKQLQAEVFPEFRVGLLHGQMKPKTKEHTMRAFARGELHLLVSTVIVEVGLDVPNATVMVIEHPERFGLAQLHQLRGRIGRGEHAAICVIVSDTTEESVRQRLSAFVQTTDGFELAEKDLEQRGPGELLGRRQHGWLRFRVANLIRDRALLESAREEAVRFLQRDPTLRDPSALALRQRLDRFRQQPG